MITTARAASTAALVLIGLFGVPFAASVHAQQSAQAAPGYLVQPGDVLEISVWKEEDLSQTVLVRPDGGLSFPLAGDINARGKSVEQLRLEIVEKLSRYIPDPVVTVSVSEINGNKIYVIGQVNEPGDYIVNPSVDVMQALSMAGGTTAFASLKDIFVLRRQGDVQVRLAFRYDEVVKGRNLDQNIVLISGDTLVVP